MTNYFFVFRFYYIIPWGNFNGSYHESCQIKFYIYVCFHMYDYTLSICMYIYMYTCVYGTHVTWYNYHFLGNSSNLTMEH